jgi:hypothetical protein
MSKPSINPTGKGHSQTARNFRGLTPNPKYMAEAAAQNCQPVDNCTCSTNDSDGDCCIREYGDNNTSCGNYQDAMVCSGGANDVTCSTDLFRGCNYHTQDNDPDQDYCCGGLPDGYANDNIDHATCTSGYDAGWGATCVWWDYPGSSL